MGDDITGCGHTFFVSIIDVSPQPIRCSCGDSSSCNRFIECKCARCWFPKPTENLKCTRCIRPRTTGSETIVADLDEASATTPTTRRTHANNRARDPIVRTIRELARASELEQEPHREVRLASRSSSRLRCLPGRRSRHRRSSNLGLRRSISGRLGDQMMQRPMHRPHPRRRHPSSQRFDALASAGQQQPNAIRAQWRGAISVA